MTTVNNYAFAHACDVTVYFEGVVGFLYYLLYSVEATLLLELGKAK